MLIKKKSWDFGTRTIDLSTVFFRRVLRICLSSLSLSSFLFLFMILSTWSYVPFEGTDRIRDELSSFFISRCEIEENGSIRKDISTAFFHILVYFTIRMRKHAETRPQREWVRIEVDSEKKEQRLPPCDIYRFILSFLCRIFSPSPPSSLSLSLQLGFFFVKKFASDSWEEMNSLLTLSARIEYSLDGEKERLCGIYWIHDAAQETLIKALPEKFLPADS